MAAVTICSDFEAQENKVCHFFHFFPHLFAMKWWNQMPWSSVFECWVWSQLFHSLLSLSLEALYFLFAFCLNCGVNCISEVIDISSCNMDSSLCFIQSDILQVIHNLQIKWKVSGLALRSFVHSFVHSIIFLFFCFFFEWLLNTRHNDNKHFPSTCHLGGKKAMVIIYH